MFYVKRGDLYFTGEFDRSVPPDAYLGSFDEALEFETFQSASDWLLNTHSKGEVISVTDVPEIDWLKAENHRLRELLREIFNCAAFQWETMPDAGRKKFHEIVKELSFKY